MKAIALILAMLLSTSPFRDVLAAENVEVRTLSAKDFSKYAADLCKRLKISGPIEITSLAHRQSLLAALNRLQLEKALQLDSDEIKKDAKAKAKIQSEIDEIVKELQKFPNLLYKRADGYFDRNPSYLTLAPTSASYPATIGSSYSSLALSESRYPILTHVVTKKRTFPPFDANYAIRKDIEHLGRHKFNVFFLNSEVPMKCDPISVVREQIKLKHGENYIK